MIVEQESLSRLTGSFDLPKNPSISSSFLRALRLTNRQDLGFVCVERRKENVSFKKEEIVQHANIDRSHDRFTLNSVTLQSRSEFASCTGQEEVSRCLQEDEVNAFVTTPVNKAKNRKRVTSSRHRLKCAGRHRHTNARNKSPRKSDAQAEDCEGWTEEKRLSSILMYDLHFTCDPKLVQ
ncbi:hypothetical protein JTE90_027923 [Oedothorax gibbosus]|uniref:Uncharacterized protein n=1 Tax=Oedothorax gibbosus TaxID=931172 RepID=A0AAV6VF08_9ARAC|nr:hypothetical protein JTE90_027923 [Oedothorax gibbosus]